MQQSLRLLEELADKGLPYRVNENPKLAMLTSRSAFAPIAARFTANGKDIHRSADAFRLNDAQLIPEGIAATGDGQRFFLGSLAQSKVVDHTMNNGQQKDLVSNGQYGLWMVVGMKVSADNKTLWLCSASERDSSNGYAGIFGIELATGRLVNKYTLDNKAGPHLFNDLVTTGDSLLYYTDSKAGNVYKLQLASGRMTAIANGFTYPNGIARNDSSTVLYIADFNGIKRIDLTNNTTEPLDSQVPTFLHQIDGLYYYNNSLIAIQDSGNNDDRIVRFYLDAAGRHIIRVEVLQSYHPDFILPTTGVIVGNDFYYIANSQLRNLQPDGSLTNAATLKRPLIKRLRLE